MYTLLLYTTQGKLSRSDNHKVITAGLRFEVKDAIIEILYHWGEA